MRGRGLILGLSAHYSLSSPARGPLPPAGGMAGHASARRRCEISNARMDWASLSKLVRSFFASRSGARFKLLYTEELLQELIDSGSGDPLRWSAARIARVLDGTPFYD
jgi:hypothetical protein